MTPHQIKALRYLARIPPGHKADVQTKAVGLRTAQALEKMGLIKLRVDTGTRRIGYGGFGAQGKRAVTETYLDVTATLTAEGRAVLRERSR